MTKARLIRSRFPDAHPIPITQNLASNILAYVKSTMAGLIDFPSSIMYLDTPQIVLFSAIFVLEFSNPLNPLRRISLAVCMLLVASVYK